MVLLISPVGCLGQKNDTVIQLNGRNAQVFYDKKIESYIIIEDSNSYRLFNRAKNRWERHSYKYVADIDFNDFLGYIPVTGNLNEPFFIVPGCGIVLKWTGNQVKRVDKSFKHLNQIGGSFFAYKNAPYLFGGYGLFTFKNIITYFDPQSSEWFLLPTSGDKPPLIQMASSKIENNCLYIFNGFNMNDEANPKSLKSVYALNLKTNTWTKVGNLNPLISKSSYESNEKRQFQIYENDFCVFEDLIVRYNFVLNRFEAFKLNSKNSIQLILENNGLYLTKFRNTGSQEYFVRIDHGEFLNSLNKSEGWIYENIKGTTLIKLVIVIFCIIVAFIFLYILWKKKKKKIKNNYYFSHSSMSNILTWKEQKLLELFIARANDGLEFSEINDLVDFGAPNIDTLKKRRELLLKDFKLKISYQYNIPIDEVIIEERFALDKRIKRLKLNKIALSEKSIKYSRY